MNWLSPSLVVASPQTLEQQEITNHKTEFQKRTVKLRLTFMIPVFTARMICNSASSPTPDVVCCPSAGTQGGGS
jgi:hypothetical protein